MTRRHSMFYRSPRPLLPASPNSHLKNKGRRALSMNQAPWEPRPVHASLRQLTDQARHSPARKKTTGSRLIQRIVSCTLSWPESTGTFIHKKNPAGRTLYLYGSLFFNKPFIDLNEPS